MAVVKKVICPYLLLVSVTIVTILSQTHHTMTTSVLDPSALLSSIPKLLPPSSKALNSPSDAIAALSHAAMTALSFRLVAADESSSPLLESDNVLPLDWNNQGPGHYAFRYKHNQSSLEFLVKVVHLGRRTLINAIALEVCLAQKMLHEPLISQTERQSGHS